MATPPSASPRRHCSRCCPARAGSRGWSTSAGFAAIARTCSAPTAEGIKGKRAKDWGLVDHAWCRAVRSGTPTVAVIERQGARGAKQTSHAALPSSSPPLNAKLVGDTLSYKPRHAEGRSRGAHRRAHGPRRRRSRPIAPARRRTPGACARSASSTRRSFACASTYPEIAVVTVRTVGDQKRVQQHDAAAREGRRDQRLRARDPVAPAPRAQALRQHRALAVRRRRRCVDSASPASLLETRARRRPLLHAARRRRARSASRPPSPTPASS
jgi:hypothetical protein